MQAERNIRKIIEEIIRKEVGADAHFTVSVPEIAGRGDYASNVAFILAKKEGKSPIAVAEGLAEKIFEKHQDTFYSIQVAQPGFLNFFLSSAFVGQMIQETLKPEKKKKRGTVSVEFVSANPTGPIHVGNARGGPLGDTISNIIEATGWKVTREYFHNDAGAQITKLENSLWHWYLVACKIPSQLPEEGYEGEYIKEIARAAFRKYKKTLLKKKNGKSVLAELALKKFWVENFATLKKLGIKFDKIIKESVLAKNKTKKVLDELRRKKMLIEKEGAVWYAPHDEFLKDRETVVAKADGTLLYFANDIAYHKEKFAKNDFVLDVFGEGHEGHIPKLKSIAHTFGFPLDHFHVAMYGQVNLIKNGEVVTMSKRKGNFVTAEEVLKEVGKDAFRFFMLQYAPRSGMQFDMTLAKKHSKDNPVYYVQYAYARAAGILRKSKKRIDLKKAKWELCESEREATLLKHILQFQGVLDDTAVDFEVQRLTRYVYELARTFTSFYETTKVIGGGREVEYARLGLALLAKQTIERTLKLLGVSAPERM
ncbi:MAG: arginine--tRNA ligase [Patescibacteria group bacterium]